MKCYILNYRIVGSMKEIATLTSVILCTGEVITWNATMEEHGNSGEKILNTILNLNGLYGKKENEMQKIISLYKRDYEGTRLVFDEVVPGAEWVFKGEGIATEKFDGTACMLRGGQLFKRYDRKRKGDKYKAAPPAWEPAQEPDSITGHWPGWLPVGDGNADQWHRAGLSAIKARRLASGIMEPMSDGTYELVGEKINANPYKMTGHSLWRHGAVEIPDCPVYFNDLKEWFANINIEGVVWHHPDGRMVKIKRKDFGYGWPDPMLPTGTGR